MRLAELHLHWGGGSYKGKKYKTYSLARSIRVNSKNSHKPIVKLGKLTEKEIAWWKKLLCALKKPDSVVTTLKDIVTRKHHAYCDVALVNKFWDYWKLDEAFQKEGEVEVPSATIARILTLNRCVDPESKSGVSKWFRETSLPQLLNVPAEKINTSRIFRELKCLENNKDNICDHLLGEYREKGDLLNQVYYDLSSTTFSGTKCVISKYGHCKEGFQTHVVLALLVTEAGLPFYWEVLPGGTADSKTVKWLLNRCEAKFKNLNITAVFDRGFVSDENLGEFEDAKIKYITAMDRNQLESICGERIEFTKYSRLAPQNIEKTMNTDGVFTKVNSNTYYKEIKIENARRYILCFNPQLFTDQRNAREEAVKIFEDDVVPDLNEELIDAKKSRTYNATISKFKKITAKSKISSFCEIELKSLVIKENGSEVNTFQGITRVDEKKKRKAMKLDGFWMLVTNLTERDSKKEFIVSSEEALRPYREKVIIEDAFRDIKSFLEISPVYVWLEKHIKAHYTICVLAYLINRTISNRLRNSKGDLSAEIKTHVATYKELKNCSIDEIYIKNLKMSNYCITELSEKQKEILSRLGAGDLTRVNSLLEKFRREA